MRYFTPSRAAESERTVRPYTLAQRFGHWYLYGHDSARGRALPFRLDRVRACELTDTCFDAPAPAEMAKAQLFSEARGEPIQIRIGREAAAWALSRPGQIKIVQREPDGSAVVEVEGASEDWATRFALSFGGQAEVISPPEARKSFADTVRRSLARYG